MEKYKNISLLFEICRNFNHFNIIENKIRSPYAAVRRQPQKNSEGVRLRALAIKTTGFKHITYSYPSSLIT